MVNPFAPSLDSILGLFSKLLTRLEKFMERTQGQIVTQQLAIREANATLDEMQADLARARAVSGKIRELIN